MLFKKSIHKRQSENRPLIGFCIIRVLLVIVLLSTFSISAHAASITDDLPLLSLSLDGRENAYSKTESVSENELINAFDASDEMGILLVTSFEMSSEKHLWYMDKYGDVIAVFTFESPGYVGVAWDGSDICLFFERGDIIEKIDCNGRLKARYSLASDTYTTDKTWKRLAYRTEKTVETGTYSLRASGLSPLRDMNSFSELVFFDQASGRKQSLYRVGTITFVQSWLYLILVISFFIFLITKIIRRQKASIRDNQGDNQGTVP